MLKGEVLDFKNETTWLMLGDCLERMKEIPDGSVDMILSDIPYGIDYSPWDITHTNTNKALLGSSPAQKNSAIFKTRGKPKNGWGAKDKNRPREFQEFCTEWLSEVMRVTKPCSPVILLSGRQNQHRLTVAAEDVGFIFKDYIVWDKKKAPFRAQNVNKVLSARGIPSVNGEYRLGCLAPITEPIVWLFKPYPVGGTITDVFLETGLGCFESSEIKTNMISLSGQCKDKFHETQKPVELMEILVKMFSRSNHVVLDMFMGSGTTGVACANTSRKFIGIELDENYFNIAKERILNMKNNS